MTSSVCGVPDLLPEERLILNCLRSEFSGGSRPIVPTAGFPDIRWEAVLETALKWCIAPMLCRILTTHQDLDPASGMPDSVVRAMEAAYVKTYVVNHSNLLALTELVKMLTAADIQVILLKGAHLAPFVYSDIGMRWMADIDILIKRDQFEKVDRLLHEAGYAYPEMGTTVWEDFGEERKFADRGAVIEWYKTHHMHLIYSNPEAVQNLEVHWGIATRTSPFAVDTEGLWNRAYQEELNGQKVWVLSPEDLILHISLHDAYYHHLRLFGLRPCCDIGVTARRFSKQIDWDRLWVRARTWGIDKYLCLMLRLSRELLQTDIPVDMAEARDANRCSEPIFHQALRLILGKETDKPVYRGIKYAIQIHPPHPDRGLLQNIAFFLKRIPISREELAARYSLQASSRRIWLYRLLRLFSLILSYAQFYIVYSWRWLRYGRSYGEEYDLNTWLISGGGTRVKKGHG